MVLNERLVKRVFRKEGGMRDLASRFGYGELSHLADPCYDQVVGEAFNLADLICQLMPESRERELAITRLEECVMWVRAALLQG